MRKYFPTIIVVLVLMFIAFVVGLLIDSFAQDFASLFDANAEELESKINYSELSPDELWRLYNEAASELDRYSDEYSDEYFDEFLPYLSRIEPFNKTGVNWDVWVEKLKPAQVFKKDLENVMYYYIIWGPEAEFIDSSFNNEKEPTALRYPLMSEDSEEWIYGFRYGVQDMMPGEVREITIPGRAAYGEEYMIEGKYYCPLKAIVLCVPDHVKFRKGLKLIEELGDALLESYMN